jgi:hypothetical protein
MSAVLRTDPRPTSVSSRRQPSDRDHRAAARAAALDRGRVACWAACCWTTAPGTAWATCSRARLLPLRAPLIFAVDRRAVNAPSRPTSSRSTSSCSEMGKARRGRRPGVPELAGAVRAERRQHPPLRRDRARALNPAPAGVRERRDRDGKRSTRKGGRRAILDEAEAKILASRRRRDACGRRVQADGLLRREGHRPHQPHHRQPGRQRDFIPTGIGAWDELHGRRHARRRVARRGRPAGPRQEREAADGGGQRRALQTRRQASATSRSTRWKCPACSGPTARLRRRGRVHLSKIKRPERLRNEDWPGITEGWTCCARWACTSTTARVSRSTGAQLRARCRGARSWRCSGSTTLVSCAAWTRRCCAPTRSRRSRRA